MTVCAVTLCDRASVSRGLCNAHYFRWKRGTLKIEAKIKVPGAGRSAVHRIPRDRKLLERMYLGQEMTLTEMANHFGVKYSSVAKVVREFGIPRRPSRPRTVSECTDCGAPVRKIRHAGNGALYGKRCADCRKQHRKGLHREYVKLPRVQAKRKAELQQWYINGAKRPKEEGQWITKGRHLLRTARRVLITGSLVPGVSAQRSAVSVPVRTSPRSCRRSSATSSRGE